MYKSLKIRRFEKEKETKYKKFPTHTCKQLNRSNCECMDINVGMIGKQRLFGWQNFN